MLSESRYFKVGCLIDGSGAPVRKRVLLTVREGIIVEIDDLKEDGGPDPALVTDLSPCIILPPLVDAHVHLALSGATDKQVREQQLSADYETLKPRIAEHVHYHFSHGVLAVRDGGDRHGYVLRYREEVAGMGRDPLLIKATGRAWHREGRYGAFIGRSPASDETLDQAFAGASDSGDYVKVINSGLTSLLEFGRESAPQFTAEEIQNLVSLAEQKGKKVMVHANGRLAVRQALEAGCHSLEHGFFMGEDNLKRMAERGTVWVPTAVTMKAAMDKLTSVHGGREREVAARNLEHQLEQIARAREYGVKVALGTDAGCSGVLHGESLVEEMKLLMKGGYSMEEAIHCASHAGARLLDLDEIGLIAKGRPANFLVARATPAMLPRKLSYLEAIYLDGEPCDKAFFNKL
ncbi:MAG: amidohydrolase family protein [Thermodesulfobacteriota bacterium]